MKNNVHLLSLYLLGSLCFLSLCQTRLEAAIPSAPTGFSASKGTYPDKVVMRWNPVAGATTYTIWRDENYIAQVAASLTSYDDVPGDTDQHTYYVKAQNSNGAGPSSKSDTGWARDNNCKTLGPWVIDGALPNTGTQLGVAALDTGILVFGGFCIETQQDMNSTYLYLPRGDIIIKSNLPKARRGPGVAVYNNQAFSIGGYLENSGVNGRNVDVWAYDSNKDLWLTKPSLSLQRASNGGAVIGDWIYTVGGASDNSGIPLNLVERYNAASGGDWSAVAPLKAQRQDAGVVAYNGKVYVFGGYHAGSFLSSMEIYDPTVDKWTSGSEMPFPKAFFATAVVGSRFYAIGGGSENGPTDSVVYYEANSGNWSLECNFPEAITFASATTFNGSVFVLGGTDAKGQSRNTVYCAPILNICETPTGFSASKGAYPNKVVLCWNPAAGATTYTIWRDRNYLAQVAKSLTCYEDNPGDTGDHTYYVKAQNSTCASPASTPDVGWVQRILPGVMLKSGNINDQSIFDTILVKAGQKVQCAFTVTAHNTWVASSIVPMAATTTWGDPPQSWWQISNWVSTGDNDYLIEKTLIAPTVRGTYYIAVAMNSAYTAEQVMSGTASDASRQSDWQHGSSVAGLSASDFETARSQGYVTNAKTWSIAQQRLYSGQHLPVTAVKIIVDNSIVKGDYNDDHQMDILWQHQDGSLAVWFMNGTDFKGANLLPVSVEDHGWNIVGNDDFNSDDQTDILWQHEDGRLAVWFMNGTNPIAYVALNPPKIDDANWKIVGTGDFNADGQADILWRYPDGRLAVWFMNDIDFNGATLLPVIVDNHEWGVVGTDDFNHDGKTDILWQHKDGRLAVWFMNGTNPIAYVALNPPKIDDPNWKIVGTGDFNADGQTDILWRYPDGRLAVWFMNGIDFNGAVSLAVIVEDSNWKVVGPE